MCNPRHTYACGTYVGQFVAGLLAMRKPETKTDSSSAYWSAMRRTSAYQECTCACTCASPPLHVRLWHSNLNEPDNESEREKKTHERVMHKQRFSFAACHHICCFFSSSQALFTAHSQSKREKEGMKERERSERIARDIRGSMWMQEAVFYEAGCSETGSSVLESQRSRVSPLCIWRIVSDKLSHCLSKYTVVSLPIRMIMQKQRARWCHGLLGLPKWEPCLWSRQTRIKKVPLL